MIEWEELDEVYGVVRHTNTPFLDDNHPNKEDVYGILIGDDSIRAFKCQRPGVFYNIEILSEEEYFERYSHIDLGSKSDDTICDDIIIFQHEDIEIQEYMQSVLDEYNRTIKYAMTLQTRFLNLTHEERGIITQCLYDASLSIIASSVNLINVRPLPYVEDYLTRNLQYDATWRGRYY